MVKGLVAIDAGHTVHSLFGQPIKSALEGHMGRLTVPLSSYAIMLKRNWLKFINTFFPFIVTARDAVQGQNKKY